MLCAACFLLWIGALIRIFRGRGNVVLENLVLRQQLAVLKRRHPRPSLGLFDKLFWVVARRVWSAWKQYLIIVTPETVVRWHRTGFRIYWRLISRVQAQVGRKPTPKKVRELIFRMVADNPTWGAPRIHCSESRRLATRGKIPNQNNSKWDLFLHVRKRAVCSRSIGPCRDARLRHRLCLPTLKNPHLFFPDRSVLINGIVFMV